ncbi:hypothetical protein FH609_011960 [Streptomyces sp. 3MP-14]|uniref:Secreted protein n=1 Tax=Streptomyces mimosae TaxID=2586635 RepID=A0A5N6AE54_9ACTN|nr:MULTISPECIES: hypothetical protein [Streptomyces]KAB8167107.1 hypothetical protein FH607_009410 [Streptomyces mimosae]KAB8177048.1 hypothetical protein FH609_011960 [Streptomyces sp. 3MP-14]
MRGTRSTRGVLPRLAAPGAAVAAVLLLGACGGGGDAGALLDQEREQDQQDQQGQQDGDADAQREVSPEELNGLWSTGTETGDSVLVIDAGSAMFATGAESEAPTFCMGAISGAALTLECQDGSSEWTEATLAPESGDLQVAWASGTEETYAPVTDVSDLGMLSELSQLPGLPGLPDPSEIPGLEELPDLSELLPELPEDGELPELPGDAGQDDSLDL